MVNEVIKGQKQKAIIKSDIVFCIDASDSMIPCIEGVKNNIKNFVEKIKTYSEAQIEVRLGFIAHNSDHETITFYIKEFTSDPEDFKNCLSKLTTQSSEANMPALDWALDFPWERNAHKFVILFTDEPIDGGWEPELSRSKIPELKQKIDDLGVTFFLASLQGPEYADYGQFVDGDRCFGVWLSDYHEYEGATFQKLLEKLGKTVGIKSMGQVAMQKPMKKDIYGVKSIANIIKL